MTIYGRVFSITLLSTRMWVKFRFVTQVIYTKHTLLVFKILKKILKIPEVKNFRNLF